MNVFINNETSTLEAVILGIGDDRGAPRTINPVMRKHLQEGTFATDESVCEEIKTFEKVLIENDVKVYRPAPLPATEQIFARDIGFVIEDYFLLSHLKHPIRQQEQDGLNSIVDLIDSHKVIQVPDTVLIEGGDVILWNDYIFVGQGDRTNANGIAFLKNLFPHKTILSLPIVVDQDSVDKNILHLDCTFQPIGKTEAIIYHGGFQTPPNELLALFPQEQLIEVSLEEKNQMFPNIFSISPQKIVIEKQFTRLKKVLTERGFDTYEVDYSEICKLGGLLRCSTLPLRRKQD